MRYKYEYMDMPISTDMLSSSIVNATFCESVRKHSLAPGQRRASEDMPSAHSNCLTTFAGTRSISRCASQLGTPCNSNGGMRKSYFFTLNQSLPRALLTAIIRPVRNCVNRAARFCPD